MRFTIMILLAALAYVVHGGFWTDIIQGLKQVNRFDNLFNDLGSFTNDLLSNDDDAAVFICEILRGDVPDAIAELPTVVEDEVADEVAALTSFVDSLPSIVPEVISDIIQGGEVVITIVEDLVTDPGAAITIIENGVESVWSDITAGAASVISDITYFFGCDIFGDCPSFTDNGILSLCTSVMKAYSVTVKLTSAEPTTATSSVKRTTSTSSATPKTTASALLASQTRVITTTPTTTPSSSSSDAGEVFLTQSGSGSTPTNAESASSKVTCEVSGYLKLFVIGLALIVLL